MVQLIQLLAYMQATSMFTFACNAGNDYVHSCDMIMICTARFSVSIFSINTKIDDELFFFKSRNGRAH